MNLNLEKWNEIYLNNQRLDKIFYSKYSSDNDIFRKNALEFLSELGELLNEAKVFKYWTIKRPDREKVLEEYADNITICLTFFNEIGLDIDNNYLHKDTEDILELANYLYEKVSLIMYHLDKDLICDIFGNLLYLGKILIITEEEMIMEIKRKHKIIEERLNSDY